MPESNLPVASERTRTAPARVPGGAAPGRPPGAGGAPPSEPSGPARRRGPARAVLGSLAFLLGLVAVLGLATLAGEPLRNALLIETDVGSGASELSFTDAPEEASGFFAARDTLTVRVPWDMTVADFLALYHLENNPSARAALRDQLGAAEPGDPLLEGDEVTFGINLTRPAP